VIPASSYQESPASNPEILAASTDLIDDDENLDNGAGADEDADGDAG